MNLRGGVYEQDEPKDKEQQPEPEPVYAEARWVKPELQEVPPAKCIAPSDICDHKVKLTCFGKGVSCQWLKVLEGQELKEFCVTQELCGDPSYKKYLEDPISLVAKKTNFVERIRRNRGG
jgi:hypothetical protein